MSTFILILSISAAILLALLLSKRAKKAEHKRVVSLAEQHDTAKEQDFLLFDLNLPFTPDVHDVIYVENEYNPVINGYIQEHYEELQQLFLTKKVTLTPETSASVRRCSHLRLSAVPHSLRSIVLWTGWQFVSLFFHYIY